MMSAPLQLNHVEAWVFRLPFRQPVRIGHDMRSFREGVLLCAHAGGKADGVIWSEAAPLPGYGSDTLEDVLFALPPVLEWLRDMDGQGRPEFSACPSLEWAVDLLLAKCAAFREGKSLSDWLGVRVGRVVRSEVRSASLGAANKAGGVSGGGSVGSSGGGTLKLKVGAGRMEDDAALVLEQVRAGTRLRLDANRAWALKEAIGFVERIGPAAEHIDFLEEPLQFRTSDVERWTAEWQELMGVAEVAGIQLALDETLRACPGLAAPVHILKPSLHGGLSTVLRDALAQVDAGKRVVFSSAFESGIGLSDLVHVAALFPDEVEGFGTHAYLAADLVQDDVGGELEGAVIHPALLPRPRVPSYCPVHRVALRRPGATAIRTPTGDVTWAAFNARVSEGVRYLTDAGLVGGRSRVAARADGSVAFATLLFAAMRCGCTLFPVNPRLPDEQVARAATLVSPHDLPEAGMGDGPGMGDGYRIPAIYPEGRIVMATSGSTGPPELITHTWSQYLRSAEAVNERVAFGPDDTWAWSLPPHHVGGLSIPVRCALAGATLQLVDPGKPGDWTGVTHASLVETQLIRLVESGHRASFKTLVVGGGPVSHSVLQRAVGAGLPVRTTYGMTEFASMITCSDIWTPEEVAEHEHQSAVHAGTPLRGWDVRMDPVQDRIQARGPTRGRMDDASESDWLTTSDRGLLDPDGHLIVLGRADRVLISGGENVPLAPIQAALERIPTIIRARIVAVPHTTFGQRPVAFVVLEEGNSLNEHDVRQRLRAELPGFMVPDRIFEEPPLPEGTVKWPEQDLVEQAVTRAATEPYDAS